MCYFVIWWRIQTCVLRTFPFQPCKPKLRELFRKYEIIIIACTATLGFCQVRKSLLFSNEQLSDSFAVSMATISSRLSCLVTPSIIKPSQWYTINSYMNGMLVDLHQIFLVSLSATDANPSPNLDVHDGQRRNTVRFQAKHVNIFRLGC